MFTFQVEAARAGSRKERLQIAASAELPSQQTSNDQDPTKQRGLSMATQGTCNERTQEGEGRPRGNQKQQTTEARGEAARAADRENQGREHSQRGEQQGEGR